MYGPASETVWAHVAKAQAATRSMMDLGSFRQPVARSGGAAHRPAERTRRTPSPAAESLVAPARPFPTKDAFSIGGNTRSTHWSVLCSELSWNMEHDHMIEALPTNGANEARPT
jgi:hypothetical protein